MTILTPSSRIQYTATSSSYPLIWRRYEKVHIRQGTTENSSEIHTETFVPCAGRKGAETRRVLSISVFTSFALLYIQLTITKITIFPDSAIRQYRYQSVSSQLLNHHALQKHRYSVMVNGKSILIHRNSGIIRYSPNFSAGFMDFVAVAV